MKIYTTSNPGITYQIVNGQCHRVTATGMGDKIMTLRDIADSIKGFKRELADYKKTEAMHAKIGKPLHENIVNLIQQFRSEMDALRACETDLVREYDTINAR